MSTAPRERREREAEITYRFKRLEVIANTIQQLIPWGSLVLISLLIYLMVRAVAGKATLAQIGMSFAADIRISDVVAYIFGCAGVGYGVNERRLRHKKTKSMAAHLAKLETKIDPGRSTSGLTPEGTTRTEDKL